jgi:SNF2 family DNA or RNA helicase
VTTPFPYQVEGAAWLASKTRAMLADEPGLGKTLQAIKAACATIEPGGQGYFHVICPAHLRENWRREIKANSTGGRRTWYVESFEEAVMHGRYYRKIDVLIIDEAHYLKGTTSKRTQAVYGPKCDAIDGMVAQAERVFLLTGTPIPNDPSELWPHCRALFPEAIVSSRTGRPMSKDEFMDRYCVFFEGERGPVITGGKNLAELKYSLGPYVLRRKAEPGMLPPIRFNDLPLTVSPAALKAIAKESKDFPDDPTIEDIARLSPHSATLRRLTGELKVAPMVQWVKDWVASGGGKLVLFAYHRDVINGIYERLLAAGMKPVKVIGGTSDKAKQAAVDAFQDDKSVNPIIGQIEAAGEGYTMTAASTLVLVEGSWVPKDYEQVPRRIRRIGQKNTCHIRFAHIAGSIDEKIQRTWMRKAETIGQIFD